MFFIRTGEDPYDPTGLVGHWHFNEGAGTFCRDETNNHNDGTNNGATWVNGKFRKALSYDGLASYVLVADSASQRFPAGFTISLWFNLSSVANSMGMVSKWDGADFSLRAFHVKYLGEDAGANKYKVRISISDGVSYTDFYSSVLFNTINTWYHLAITYDLANVKFYVNGNIDTTTPYALALPAAPTNNIDFGKTGGYFNGVIDEVRIYSRTLLALEIKYDYDVGK